MCDIWEKWVSGWRKKKTPNTELNSEIWGKGVCDIWEKWVVWVEKSNTSVVWPESVRPDWSTIVPEMIKGSLG